MARSAKANKGGGARSLLETAFDAYRDGDVVLARQVSERLLAGPPADAEAEAARTIGPKLTGRDERDPQALARELIDRVKGPNKAYLFAAVTAAVYLLMLYLASRG